MYVYLSNISSILVLIIVFFLVMENLQKLILQYLEEYQQPELLEALSDLASSSTWSARHGSVLTISSMLRHNPSMLCASPSFSSVVDCLKDASKDEKVTILFQLSINLY